MCELVIVVYKFYTKTGAQAFSVCVCVCVRYIYSILEIFLPGLSCVKYIILRSGTPYACAQYKFHYLPVECDLIDIKLRGQNIYSSKSEDFKCTC